MGRLIDDPDALGDLDYHVERDKQQERGKVGMDREEAERLFERLDDAGLVCSIGRQQDESYTVTVEIGEIKDTAQLRLIADQVDRKELELSGMLGALTLR